MTARDVLAGRGAQTGIICPCVQPIERKAVAALLPKPSGFGGWTKVVGTPGGGVLFYNANDGSGATAVVDSDEHYSFAKTLEPLGTNWTHVTSVGQNGLVFYAYVDEVGGVISTALLDGSGNFTWQRATDGSCVRPI